VPIPDTPTAIPIGTGEILEAGERVALLGYGWGVQVANDAAALLAEHGIHPTVADARFAKPLDADLVDRLCGEHDLVVTIEENVLAGGFGAAVLEHAEEALDRDRARILRIGLPDRYVTHGKPALLREEVGLTGPDVVARVMSALGDRAPA
jgi:1-deoxy-D-xylulose-5-phosphate synthase